MNVDEQLAAQLNWENNHILIETKSEINEEKKSIFDPSSVPGSQKVYRDHMMSEKKMPTLPSFVEAWKARAEEASWDPADPLNEEEKTEISIHRMIRFFEYFSTYWSERDESFPTKTFGPKALDTGQKEPLDLWYKDPKNVQQDLEAYARAAKYYGEILAKTAPPHVALELWETMVHDGKQKAWIFSSRMRYSEYKLIQSIKDLSDYISTRRPIYNPELPVIPKTKKKDPQMTYDTSDDDDDSDLQFVRSTVLS